VCVLWRPNDFSAVGLSNECGFPNLAPTVDDGSRRTRDGWSCVTQCRCFGLHTANDAALRHVVIDLPKLANTNY
jgi:hypothetical protein